MERKKREIEKNRINNDEPKYKKKQKFPPLELDTTTPVYTKKIVVEERRVIKETTPDVNDPRKYLRSKVLGKQKEKERGSEYEREKEKERESGRESERENEKLPKINPYRRYKNRNIRINMIPNRFDDDKIENKEFKNNPYSKYMKSTTRQNDKRVYRGAKTESGLADDLEKIENYNVNTYLKKDLLQIYDSINEEFNNFKKDIFNTNINNFEVKMGEFDKYKVPYYYKRRKVDDLCKGRVTSEDMYKKYSHNAKRYGKEQYYK